MKGTVNSAYQTKSAILFILFNRPDTTGRVFECIRAAKPARLYIAADGPRIDRAGENELCANTRKITELVDWDCQVFTLFHDVNLGCKNAVSQAVTWFFDYEEDGIVLEDDCMPDNSFFRFCDELLDRYRTDERISIISGCNFQQGNKRGNADYYFSNLSHVWGWASWRRVWQDYDKELSRYTETDARLTLQQIFDEPLIADSWLHIFNELKAGRIDTWDYQLAFLNFFKNRLSVIPNQNLISNIGFGASATHTTQVTPNANIPLGRLPENITHPADIQPDKAADRFTLDRDFDVATRKLKQNRLSYRIKRFLKRK